MEYIDDTREDVFIGPMKYPSKQPDEDSMHRDHISRNRASYMQSIKIDNFEFYFPKLELLKFVVYYLFVKFKK